MMMMMMIMIMIIIIIIIPYLPKFETTPFKSAIYGKICIQTFLFLTSQVGIRRHQQFF